MILPAALLALAVQAPDTASPGTTLLPIPVIFYQPETGTGFGAGISYVVEAPRVGRKAGRPDGYSLFAIYTTRSQLLLSLGAELYPAGQAWIMAETGYSRFPTKHWGIGNDAAEAAEEDYTPRTFRVAVDARRRLGHALWAGVAVEAAHRALVETVDTGLLAAGALPGAVDGRMIGVGPSLTWDTRDGSLWPRAGGLYLLRAVGYGDATRSDFGFSRLTVDLRRYLPVLGDQVVALRVLGEFTGGTPPFDRLPQLGGERLLRGYYEGRFRDRHLLALQGEYRLPVWRRFGVVAFASAGQVAARPGDFAVDRFRAAVGGGLRFRVSPDGLNLRVDVAQGLTVQSGGFYLGVQEVF